MFLLNPFPEILNEYVHQGLHHILKIGSTKSDHPIRMKYKKNLFFKNDDETIEKLCLNNSDQQALNAKKLCKTQA